MGSKLLDSSVTREHEQAVDFLADMSHELRTPLSVIIGFAELIHDGMAGPITDVQKEYMGDIVTSSRHLLQLINDIVDLAKLESGKLDFHLEPVAMDKLVGEVCDTLRTTLAKKDVQLKTEVDASLATVMADPTVLKQVLGHYLSSAIEFVPDQGGVTVRVLPEGEERFRIEVEGAGAGSTLKGADSLSMEFQPLDAGTPKRYKRRNLGMALTKRIVEALGGTAGVNRTPGQGGALFASLPRVMQAGGDTKPEADVD